MANSFFQFKKFIIRQDLCAMKVGTDGVLLGAWASITNCAKILDVGTGTGLIALMLAQRCNSNHQSFHIDAIEIDADAYRQASVNVNESLYKETITVYHMPFSEYAKKRDKTYDLIVSNPPYFTNSLKCPDSKRSTARHNDSLSLNDLLEGCCKLLKSRGKLALILPAEQEKEIEQIAANKNIYFTRKTYVLPIPEALPKRILMEFSLLPSSILQTNKLTIEESRHRYTPEYIELTKDFYLKM